MAKKNKVSPRSAARLAVVQALYQMDMSDDSKAPMLIEEYVNHRLGQELEGDQYGAADQSMFSDIVAGTMANLDDIDQVILPCLSKGWPLERIERILKAILRAAAYEMTARPDVPTPVIINEYIEVTKAFYEKSESGFINGVLDQMGRNTRG